MTLPALGRRSIDSYNQLQRELAAFYHVRNTVRPAGSCNAHTLFALNGLYIRANRLFRHHPDLPRFVQVSLAAPLSQLELEILVTHLAAACLDFEQRYAHLTEEGRNRARVLANIAAPEA